MSFSDTAELINLFPEFTRFAQHFYVIGTVISVAIAVCTLFWGYKLLKFWVSLAGFVIGAVLGVIAGVVLQAEISVIIGAVIAAGIIFACLSFFFYKAGVFLLVGIIVYGLVTTLIYGAVGVEMAWWIVAIGVAAGIAAGILAVKFIRPMVIMSTSINGGATLAFTICPLLGIESYAVMLITTAVLAFMGLMWQFHTTSSGKRYTKDNIL